MPENNIITEITMEEFKKLNFKKIYILDVRELDEYNECHIPESVLIPVNKVMDKLFDLPVWETIYVICRVWNRSWFAANMLNMHGFHAINVLWWMEAYNLNK